MPIDDEYAWVLDAPFDFEDGVLDENWAELHGARSEIACGHGCGSVRREHYGTPVDVRLVRTPRSEIHPSPLAGVVSARLASLLKPELQGAVWGTCVLTPSGVTLESHVCVYTPAALCAVVRGGHGTRYRRCGKCGMEHIGRPSKTDDARYIERASIPAGRRAAQMLGHGGFVVSEAFRCEILPHVGGVSWERVAFAE